MVNDTLLEPYNQSSYPDLIWSKTYYLIITSSLTREIHRPSVFILCACSNCTV